MKKTLHKYISNEIWPTFLVTLFVSVFIILATKMLSITDLIVNQGVYAGYVFRMVLYLLPNIIAFALPAASLMAVLVGFLRLSVDSEIIALKSSGVSLYQMLPPVILLSFLFLSMSFLTGIMAVPWGNRSFKDLVFQLAQTRADLGIKERIFSEPFDDVVFYVNRFSRRDRIMKNVFVVDSRDSLLTNTIIAEEGKILSHPEERILTLHFENGTIFSVEKNLRSARSIKFDTYNLNIGLKDIMAALASRQKSPNEMTPEELISQLKIVPKGEHRHNEMTVELLEKISVPIAVFLMGLIGVPLGAQIRARGRSTGIGISLVVFFIYYMCLVGIRSLCETGTINPVFGVWIPDLFLVISSIFLLRRAANERSISFLPGFIFRTKESQYAS